MKLIIFRRTFEIFTVASLVFLIHPLTAQQNPQQKNLFQRGDFSRGTRVDNLWDGVSSNNQLQTPQRPRVAPRENATLANIQMPVSAVMADVTQNGLPDIIAGTPDGHIWVFPNSGEPGKPRFTRGEILPLITFIQSRWIKDGLSPEELSTYVPRLHIGTWSSPTSLDLVIGTFYGEVFRVPISAIGGKITFSNFDATKAEIRLSGTPNYYFMNLADPVVVDWNGDGRKDLLLGEGSFSANTIWFLENTGTDGSPRFEAQNAVQLIEALGDMQLKPAVVDWNNDGRLDLFVVNEKGDAQIYLRKDNGSLSDPQQVLVGGGNFGIMSSVKIADYNNDGNFDLLIGRNNGAIQIALNTGTPGSPAFAAATPIAGTDLFLPYERPIGWTLNNAEHVPYYILEIFNDPSNTVTSSPNLQNSGGNCLRFYFIEPQNTVVSGQFSRNLQNQPHTIRSDGSIRLKAGQNYELSFRCYSNGFTNIKWSLTGVIYSKETTRETDVTRRGEQRATPGQRRLGLSSVDGTISSSSWTSVRQSIRVPSLPDSQDYVNHELVFAFIGQGDFRLDDVVIVEK
jgi:hypothetical protein